MRINKKRMDQRFGSLLPNGPNAEPDPATYSNADPGFAVTLVVEFLIFFS
jgi:hypothetical protein